MEVEIERGREGGEVAFEDFEAATGRGEAETKDGAREGDDEEGAEEVVDGGEARLAVGFVEVVDDEEGRLELQGKSAEVIEEVAGGVDAEETLAGGEGKRIDDDEVGAGEGAQLTELLALPGKGEVNGIAGGRDEGVEASQIHVPEAGTLDEDGDGGFGLDVNDARGGVDERRGGVGPGQLGEEATAEVEGDQRFAGAGL